MMNFIEALQKSIVFIDLNEGPIGEVKMVNVKAFLKNKPKINGPNTIIMICLPEDEVTNEIVEMMDGYLEMGAIISFQAMDDLVCPACIAGEKHDHKPRLH